MARSPLSLRPFSRRSPALALAAHAAAAAALIASALGGCNAEHAYHGSGDILASYSVRTLKADLPPSIRVPGAIAAAGSALRSRGYAVVSSEATEDKGRVVATAPGATMGERTVVTVRQTDTGVRVSITAEPFGDESRSRLVLDAMLARLGL